MVRTRLAIINEDFDMSICISNQKSLENEPSYLPRHLPIDILTQIFEFSKPTELLNLALVNHEFLKLSIQQAESRRLDETIQTISRNLIGLRLYTPGLYLAEKIMNPFIKGEILFGLTKLFCHMQDKRAYAAVNFIPYEYPKKCGYYFIFESFISSNRLLDALKVIDFFDDLPIKESMEKKLFIKIS
jgi:hypothetical protein